MENSTPNGTENGFIARHVFQTCFGMIFVVFFAFFSTCSFFENALAHCYLRGILRVGTFMRTQALILLALFFDYVFWHVFLFSFVKKKLKNRIQESVRPKNDSEDHF